MDIKTVMKLAPFLGQKCLEELLSRCKEDIYLEHVRRLSPFVSSNCLKELVRKAKDKKMMLKRNTAILFICMICAIGCQK